MKDEPRQHTDEELLARLRCIADHQGVLAAKKALMSMTFNGVVDRDRGEMLMRALDAGVRPAPPVESPDVACRCGVVGMHPGTVECLAPRVSSPRPGTSKHNADYPRLDQQPAAPPPVLRCVGDTEKRCPTCNYGVNAPGHRNTCL